jgi:Xaa-Pro aminopeptidase
MQAQPGINQSEYAERRRRLASKMPAHSIAVLVAGSEKYRNADTEYPFRQDSNFYYLTGFCEPKAVLLILKGENDQHESVLFCQESLPETEIWTGAKTGPAAAIREYGMHRAYDFESLDTRMLTLLENKKHILYSLGYSPEWDTRVTGWINNTRAKIKSGIEFPTVWIDPKPWIHEARLFKSPAEIALLRKAAEISADAHIRLIKNCKPTLMEYELEAFFLQACYSKGCRAMAYPCIIGGGKNACTLHYIQNNQALQSGDLVLIDAGGEYQYYAADITRTIPVNGKFSAEQKLLYELVLRAQLAAIGTIKPNIPWNTIQETILNILVPGLLELGILKGALAQCIEEKTYQRFYMHSSGHWLGLDVHDVGTYKKQGKFRVLEPGMVLTVEPGLYIAPNQSDVDKRWWGIGIRIEDDILVTQNGHEVLTQAAPKTIPEIEALMYAS